jgi:predicted nucleotidyltransferase
MRMISLLDTLMPSTRQNILAATVLHPEKSWYLRELAEFLNVSPSSIQRELANLTKAGILKKTIDGNRTYFNADQNCPIFPELKSVLIKTVGVVDLLQHSLKLLLRKISVAFIFGSIASGTENSESDIDLFIVGDVELMEVVKATKNTEHTLRRSINPIVLSITEAKRKLKEKHSFIERVRKSDKLFLIGEDNELGKAFS